MRLLVSAGALAIALSSQAWAADLYRQQATAAPSIASAASDPILAANNEVLIQFVTTNFDYSEHYNGALLDTEKGWVPGIGGEITVMQNFIVSNFYLDAQFSYLTGQTDYVGAYIGRGNYGSLIAKSGADVYDMDFRVGKGFALSPAVMATPYIGAGFHEWDRAVNAGEIYSHGYAGGGLLLQWAPTDKLVLFANGLVGSTFASYITVNGPNGFAGNLGDSLIWKAGGGVDYAVTNNIHANAKVEFTEFDYGHSATYAGGWFEPNSNSQNITVKVGLGYSWGGGCVPLK